MEEIHENLVSTKQKTMDADEDRDKLMKEVENHVKLAKQQKQDMKELGITNAKLKIENKDILDKMAK